MIIAENNFLDRFLLRFLQMRLHIWNMVLQKSFAPTAESVPSGRNFHNMLFTEFFGLACRQFNLRTTEFYGLACRNRKFDHRAPVELGAVGSDKLFQVFKHLLDCLKLFEVMRADSYGLEILHVFCGCYRQILLRHFCKLNAGLIQPRVRSQDHRVIGRGPSLLRRHVANHVGSFIMMCGGGYLS